MIMLQTLSIVITTVIILNGANIGLRIISQHLICGPTLRIGMINQKYQHLTKDKVIKNSSWVTTRAARYGENISIMIFLNNIAIIF